MLKIALSYCLLLLVFTSYILVKTSETSIWTPEAIIQKLTCENQKESRNFQKSFKKKKIKKIKHKKKKKIQKKIFFQKKRSRVRPNLARPDPTWPRPGPAPTNLPETKTFQFCKNISLRNRGKVFPNLYPRLALSHRDYWLSDAKVEIGFSHTKKNK